MRKFITLSILSFLTFTLFAQQGKRATSTIKNKPGFAIQQLRLVNTPIVTDRKLNKSARPLAVGDCQIIDPGFDIDSSTVLLTDADNDGTEDGYVVGTNPYDDQEKANYYDFSGALAKNYLIGVGILFADAQGTDLTKIVTIRVYDGTTGVPGTELGHADLTMQTIADSLASETYYGVPVQFTNLQLPASKKVFISIDMSNLDYFEGDLLGVYSSDWDYLTVNTAWEQWDTGVWYSFTDPTDGWGSAVTITMVPVVGESPVCTQLVVPVTLTSFKANTFGTSNKLEWTVATEINNKGYELERSFDGVSFNKVGFVASQVASGNSTVTLQYSFIDNAPASQKSYYRIKQIDMNGKATYSKIVFVNRGNLLNTGLVQIFPNPVRNSLNLVVDVPANKPAVITVYDNMGRTLMQKNLQSNGANQNISFNVSALSKGTYFVKLNGEGTNKLLKFVKE